MAHVSCYGSCHALRTVLHVVSLVDVNRLSNVFLVPVEYLCSQSGICLVSLLSAAAVDVADMIVFDPLTVVLDQ